MKKSLIYIIVLAVIVSLCGCGSMKASKDAYDSMFEPGTKLSAEGGQVELVKVHTASRLYPTVHFGSYIQTNDEDMCYIDVVLDVKAGKKALYSADFGGVTAIGNVSGETYTDSICAVECDDNRNLRTNTSIEAGDSALVHMAVEVPADTEDDEFEVKVDILSATYSFLYEFGDSIDNIEKLNKGQSISGQTCKAKIKDVYYSHELYEDAPAVCDSYDDYVYLIAELDVTNKAFEDADFHKMVSVSAVIDNIIYDARYIMQDEAAEEHYVSDGKIPSLETAQVLAVIDLPLEYSSRDARLEFALDRNEYSYTLKGDSSIAYNRERELEQERIAEEAQQKAREEAARLAEEMERLAAEQEAQQEAESASEEEINETEPVTEPEEPATQVTETEQTDTTENTVE